MNHDNLEDSLPPKKIKHIKIISNNICYGPAPKPIEEIEQHLTIASSGRVWFSAKNFKQYSIGNGFCRKKQFLIGKWKAEFIFEMIQKLPECMPIVTDVGNYTLDISYDDGENDRICGSLIGNVYSYSYNNNIKIELSKLIRRQIPVSALWVFNSSLSPDYEGNKAIYHFAQNWENFFINTNLKYNFEEDFGKDCMRLGFQMDCGNEFSRLCSSFGYTVKDNLEDALKKIDDIDVIGSGLFSHWRYLTHWAYQYQLDEEECNRFLLFIRRLKELTAK